MARRRRTLPKLVLASLAFTAAGLPLTARAELGTTTDSELANSDWTVVPLVDDTPMVDALFEGTQRTGGGNPGAFRHTANSWTHDGDGWSTVAGGHLRADPDFDPSRDGALGTVTVAADLITTQTTLPSDAVLLFFPVLRQGDTYYASSVAADSTGQWAQGSWGPLSAADFDPIAGDSQAPLHPEFGATGSPITFGIGVQSGPHAFAGSFTTEGGIDNWQLTLSAPSSDGGAGGAGGGTGADGGDSGSGAATGAGLLGPATAPATSPDRSEADCSCRLASSHARALPPWLLGAGVMVGAGARRARLRRRRARM